ncbi:NAD(P)-binding protein [Mycena amicta]|nr:NAD(P)-binding protein [Mycena amicta]
MSSFFDLIGRVRTVGNPPEAKPAVGSKPLKFGILGAANIAPDALIRPVKSHPEAIVYAVAARSKDRAASFAKTHGIEKVYGSYQELLDDPDIDCVYNPLPNGLHYEWTMKALAAGKHVLLEKPAANTAEETRAMFELAEQKNLVLLEAFHYRFHPVAARVKEILDSGELGPIKSTKTALAVPGGFVKSDDIRYDYSLGGGALMDMGCYPINAMRFLTGKEPASVTTVVHQLATKACGKPKFELVDRRTEASFALPGGITSSIVCDLNLPATLGLLPKMPDLTAAIKCEKGEIKVMNYLMPTFYHSITVTPTKGKQRVEKAYTFPTVGEAWWSTYRYQLEAFVNKVRGRPVHAWVSKEDSIANMEAIESVYAKSGLGSRPKSEWVPQ